MCKKISRIKNIAVATTVLFSFSFGQAQSVSELPKALDSDEVATSPTEQLNKKTFIQQNQIQNIKSSKEQGFTENSRLMQGTESGGGGTTLTIKTGGRVLLDLLRIDSAISDKSELQIKSAGAEDLIYHRLTVDALSTTANSSLTNSGPYQLALKLIEDWKKNEALSAMASLADIGLFSPVQWNWVAQNNSSFVPADLSDFQTLDPRDPKIAAYYENKEDVASSSHIYSVSILAPEWNQLGLLSQTGLLVHEGLRHLQFFLVKASEDNPTFDDVGLQRATAILMLCKPRPMLNQYINFVLTGVPYKNIPAYSNFNQLINSYCIRKISTTGEIDLGGVYQ